MSAFMNLIRSCSVMVDIGLFVRVIMEFGYVFFFDPDLLC